MLVRCACGWEKDIRDDLRGKTGMCPKCGAKVELQPAMPVTSSAANASAASLSLMPAEEDAEEAWTPPAVEAEEDADEVREVAPSHPRLSPWKTPNLKTLRERVKGHFPAVASGAWYLEFYGAFARIAAIVIVALAGLALVVGLAGVSGMVSPNPKAAGLASLQQNALHESMTWNGLTYFLSLSFAAVAVLASGAASRLCAELSVAWAAGLVSQQISPCGGLPRED